MFLLKNWALVEASFFQTHIKMYVHVIDNFIEWKVFD